MMIDKNKLRDYLNEYEIEISAESINMLDTLSEMLIEKNKSVNLTAIKDADGVLIRHLLDSLLVFKYMDFARGASVIDVGCGAGFPSLPMLIARNDLNITFLDSTAKKLDFISSVLAKLNLKGEVCHGRAEELSKENVSRETFDFALARAVANLPSLCELTLPFVKPGGFFIAMKGKEGEEELEQAKVAIKTLGARTESFNSFVLPDGSSRTIIVIKKISQTPTKYPRASSAILKKPLK